MPSIFFIVSTFFTLTSSTIITTNIFTAGEQGYVAFRIPGITTLANNTVLAVAEGRRYGCSDFGGQHDLVSKHSKDNGKTWSPLNIVANPTTLFNCNSYFGQAWKCQFWDPTPVFDADTGLVHLLTAYTSSNTTAARENGIQDIFQFTSYDNGVTFNQGKNISHFFGSPNMSPANGHGIQLSSNGKFQGRLVIPVYGTKKQYIEMGSGIYYSDDHGKTWESTIPFAPTTAEGDVAELQNGSLLYTLRYDAPTPECAPLEHCRLFARSDDGGINFASTIRLALELPDPGCKAGLASRKKDGLLFFANDANGTQRSDVTLRVSKDEGMSWNEGVLLETSAAGYVDLIVNDEYAFVIYEQPECGEIVVSRVGM